MAPTRRAFLKETAFGVAALALARPFSSSLIASSGDPPGLAFFSEEEHAVVAAAAQRLLGIYGEGSSPTIDVALRADRFLSGEDPEVQEQFHLLLTIFNSQIAAFLFSLKFSSFLDMGPQSQDDYLEGWMTSRLGFRRTAFQGLKRLCMSMYYTHPASFAPIGYAPVVHPPEER
jgi:hypothetical protein